MQNLPFAGRGLPQCAQTPGTAAGDTGGTADATGVTGTDTGGTVEAGTGMDTGGTEGAGVAFAGVDWTFDAAVICRPWSPPFSYSRT